MKVREIISPKFAGPTTEYYPHCMVAEPLFCILYNEP